MENTNGNRGYALIDKLERHYEESAATLFVGDTPRVRAMREQALARFLASGFPDKKMENWRHSKLLSALSNDYDVALQVLDSQHHSAFCCSIQDFDTDVVMLKNGCFAGEQSLVTLDDGVIVGSSRAAMQQYPDIFDKYFGTIADSDDSFADVNTAFWNDGFFIYVPKNVVGKRPIQIIKLIEGHPQPFIQTRNLIVLESGARLQIVDCDDSTSEQGGFVNALTEIVIGENAQLDKYKLQNINDETTLLNANVIRQSRDAVFRSSVISFNGGMIRNQIRVELDGENAETEINGLYLVDKTQHVDNQLRVNHNVSHCRSNEHFKGILDDESTAVFNGYVYVAPDAQATEACQNNNNVILTPTAKINSMPFLEILADDVKCSHGTTTGQLDDEALFYMRQRGISKSDARMLLMYAFAAEVSNRISIEPLRERIDDMIKKRLRGELRSCDSCVLRCSNPKDYNFEIDYSKI